MRKTLLIISLGLYCCSVSAVDVTIQINGGILAQSCNVSSQDLTKNINFPDLNPGDFSYSGATSVEQGFSIHLENCTGSVSNLTYEFSGEADNTDPTLLKVLGKGSNHEGGTASGLAIEILDDKKNRIDLNSVHPLNTTISSNAYILDFFLRYRSTENKVGSGNASSVVYLDIYYE